MNQRSMVKNEGLFQKGQLNLPSNLICRQSRFLPLPSQGQVQLSLGELTLIWYTKKEDKKEEQKGMTKQGNREEERTGTKEEKKGK